MAVREVKITEKGIAELGKKKQFTPTNWSNFSDILQQRAGEEQRKKSERGFLGNLVGGITDPIARTYEAAKFYMGNQDPGGMSATSQLAYEQDPTRFAGQRLADAGSLALMLLPGGAGLKGAVGLGAGIGGLGAIGGAGKDENLLKAGLGGALTGGVLGAAGYGVGKLLQKGGQKLGASKTKSLAQSLQEPDLEKLVKVKGRGPLKTQQAKNEFLQTSVDEFGRTKQGFLDIVRENNAGKIPDLETLINQSEAIRTQAGRDLQEVLTNTNKPLAYYHQIEKEFLEQFHNTGLKRKAQEVFREKFPVPETYGFENTSTPVDTIMLQEAKQMLGSEITPQGLSSLKPTEQKLYDFLRRKIESVTDPEVARLNNIIHQVKIFETEVPRLLGMSTKSYERFRVPGTPFSLGAPIETGRIGDKVRAGIGKQLAKVSSSKLPQKLGSVGGFLQNPNLGKLGGLIGAQQGQEPQTQIDQGMPSVMGYQGQSNVNNEIRKQLFIQLFNQYPDESPSAIATMVDMFAPETKALSEGEQKKADTANIAAQTLQMLESDPSMAGKISTIGGGISEFFGGASPATAYRANIAALNNKIKVALAGTAMNAQEKKMLENLMVQPTDEAARARVKLQQIIQLYGQ